MELIINQKLLSQALSKIRTIVERRTINEILQHVLIETIDNQLLIKATDNEVMVPQYVNTIKISKAGSIIVPAHLLGDIIKKAPDSCDVIFKSDDKVLNISYGKAKFILNILSNNNFPIIDTNQDFAIKVEVNTDNFINVLNKIKCAISSDEIRYYLNGVFLHFDNQSNLVAVSTDAHKLAQHVISNAKITVNNDSENPLNKGIIIPRKIINELHKFIDIQFNDLSIKINKNNIQFEQNNNVVLYSSLIDGTFPDYQNILNIENNAHKIIIPSSSDLVEAINRVSLLSADNSHRVMMKFTKNNLDISVIDSKIGSANESIAVVYDEVPLNIVLNSNYASAILCNFAGSIEMLISSEISPVIINLVNNQDLTYVLMPMHNV